MENDSIEKNLSKTEIYSVIVMADDFVTACTYVTLDRRKALVRAYDEYYKCQPCQPCYNVFIDTWRDDVLIKVEYIDNNGNLVVDKDYNV